MPYLKTPIEVRFWKYVEKTEGCWNWTGRVHTSGYGDVCHLARHFRSHRMSFFLTHGRWPSPNLCVLHKCDNRLCVNPAHLYEGTKKQNSRDALERGRHWPAKVAHCARGHVFDVENTRHYNGQRYCRACERLRTARRRLRRRLEKRLVNPAFDDREGSWSEAK